MAAIPQTHHGLCIADIDAARVALATIGFTEVQPNAPVPLVYADTPDDIVGQRTCPDLGSPYRTHYVEHPGTHHQIDLIEINAGALVDRPSTAPLSGDLTIVMPLPGTDLVAAAEALHPYLGDRVVVTDGGEPWATVHIAASAWPDVRAFVTDMLGVALEPVGAAGDRWRLQGIGGRIEVAVSTETLLPDASLGKRYAGANHLRLLHRDLAAIDAALPECPGARWLLPPEGAFAFIAGPGGLTIELFDKEVTQP